MLGLTPLGTFHTAISLVAVGAGLIALIRDQAISPKNTLARSTWSRPRVHRLRAGPPPPAT